MLRYSQVAVVASFTHVFLVFIGISNQQTLSLYTAGHLSSLLSWKVEVLAGAIVEESCLHLSSSDRKKSGSELLERLAKVAAVVHSTHLLKTIIFQTLRFNMQLIHFFQSKETFCVTCPPVRQPPSSEGPGHFNAFGQVGRFIGLRLHTERGVLAVVHT